MAVIPSEKIRSGEYSVGLYIRGDDMEALEFTDWVLSKSAGEVCLALRISNSHGIGKHKYWIDSLEKLYESKENSLG
jgi:hypothetical protein